MKETIYSTDYQSASHKELERLKKLQEVVSAEVMRLEAACKIFGGLNKFSLPTKKKIARKAKVPFSRQVREAITEVLSNHGNVPLSNKEIRGHMAELYPNLEVTSQDVSGVLSQGRGSLFDAIDGKYRLRDTLGAPDTKKSKKK